jgi:hypothetical protein
VMAMWTALSEVEDSRVAEIQVNFAPSLVRIVNFVAPNDFPRKFVYKACPFRLRDTGMLCLKSLEFGSKCGHQLPPIMRYRFLLRIAEAAYPTVMEPICAQIWDVGSLLLDCPADDFFTAPEIEQLLYLAEITQCCTRVSVSLTTKDGFIKIQHISFLYGRPSAKLPVSLRVLKGTQRSPIVIDSDHEPGSSTQVSSKKEKAVLAELRALV